MPAVSEAQRRLLFARFGKEWVRRHHFDNKGRLPAYAPKRKPKGKHGGHRRRAVEQLLNRQ